jgi:DNA-binding transcriptional MocR family regulator
LLLLCHDCVKPLSITAENAGVPLMTHSTNHWLARLAASERPAYLQLPDLIAQDVEQGRLAAGDRLPPLRELATLLGLDYTTVARGYAEARKRGLVESLPGAGTYVRGGTPSLTLRGGLSAEMSMNLPPEPRSAALLARMRESSAQIFAKQDLYGLLRYQEFGGTEEDRAAGAQWLRRQLPGIGGSEVLVCPGIHSVLVSLVSQLVPPGEYMCVESLTYPGIKAIATQLGVKLHPLPIDREGPSVEAFEEACKTLHPKVFYCNPTLQNPTTSTFSARRREGLADVALRYNVAIIEDDPYAMLPLRMPEPLALLAPELTYYVTGFSKCLGAGVRIAYVKPPDPQKVKRLAATMRAFTVMSSPVTNALATHWVNDGTAEAVLDAVRADSSDRQDLARKILAGLNYFSEPESFHLWLELPPTVSPVEFSARMCAQGVWVVASAAFSTDGNPPPAVRVCLGGALSWSDCRDGLTLLVKELHAAAAGTATA